MRYSRKHLITLLINSMFDVTTGSAFSHLKALVSIPDDCPGHRIWTSPDYRAEHGTQDNCLIKITSAPYPLPRRRPLQPLGTNILVFRVKRAEPHTSSLTVPITAGAWSTRDNSLIIWFCWQKAHSSYSLIAIAMVNLAAHCSWL